jgi:hypothetical protein
MELLPPFEALPDDKRSLRLRAVRDGLIVSGWLATLFTFTVVINAAHSFGYDAYSYWSIDLHDLYGRAMVNNFTHGAFRYAPPIAYLFASFALLPWWVFIWLWSALSVAIVTWLAGRWTLVVLALPPVALELYHGNVHLLIAAAIALGFRFPWTWSFVILTKITPGVGILWFAARREWRSFAIAVGVTAAVVAITYVIDPSYWADFTQSILGNLDQPQYYSIPPPAWVRVPIAILVVIWGARTDRPWTVAVAATLGLPILWPHGLTVLLAAIPFLRRGDRAAVVPGWERAANPRTLAINTAVFVGGALLLALIAPDALRSMIDWASSNFRP